MEDVETETHRDSSKGVETETESLATHWTIPFPVLKINFKLLGKYEKISQRLELSEMVSAR